MSAVNIASLTPQERLELIGELWDSLEAEMVPLTEAQRAELDRRAAHADAHPEESAPWEEVMARLDSIPLFK